MPGYESLPSSASASPSPSSRAHRQHGGAKRRPIPRKGHTKSRAGCPTCKRRKVKCDEVTPVCGPCKRLGLECAYPLMRAAHARRGDGEGEGEQGHGLDSGEDTALASASRLALARAVPQPLAVYPGSFGFTDLRFFQHFLISAFPPLPVGGRYVWQYISQMSHEYDFLIHSMLGLGASHLSLLAPGDFTHSALQHRVTAIEKLNKFLSRPRLSIPDTEAAFAAILTLTFQAAHMPDGLADFLTMTRGCFLVGTHIVDDLGNSTFRTFERDVYVEKASFVAASDEQQLPLLDESIVAGFCTSLEQLGPLCHSLVDIEHIAMMRRIVTSATTDLYECFREHSFLHEKAGRLSAADFAAFIDPSNHVARLVIVHMLLLDIIMSRTICVWEDGPELAFHETRHRYDARNVMAIIWMENIYESLPDRYRPFAEWPLAFSRYMKTTFRADTTFWRLAPAEDGSVAEQEQEQLQLEGCEAVSASSIL